MGTNFYWAVWEPLGEIPQSVTLPTGKTMGVIINEDDPTIHIGKRSAAGYYCYACMITLCKEGNNAIHRGHSEWYDECPVCGQRPVKEGLDSGPAGMELGFAKPRETRPTDVRGASSFSWAQEPDEVRRICTERPDEELIVDEYGRSMTCQQFLDMLEANCPIQFFDSTDTWFS